MPVSIKMCVSIKKLLLLLILCLTVCVAACDSVGDAPPPNDGIAGIWEVNAFGERGRALLVVDEASQDQFAVRFLFYEYRYYYEESEHKSMSISEINATAERLGDEYRFLSNGIVGLNYVSSISGVITVSKGELFIRYDEIIPEASYDVELITDDDGALIRYSHGIIENALPTVFTVVTNKTFGECMSEFPLFYGEIEFPFATPDDVDKLLGEPLSVTKSDYYENCELITYIYENMEIRFIEVTHEDGSVRYILIAFNSTDSMYISRARDIVIGDSIDTVITRFLCEDDDYRTLLLSPDENDDAVLYGLAWNAHNFGHVKFNGMTPVSVRYVTDGQILQFILDENGIVTMINYRLLF